MKLRNIKPVSGRSKYEKIFTKEQVYGNWKTSPGVSMDEKGRAYVLCQCTNPQCGALEYVACHHLVYGRSTQCKQCNNSEKTRGKNLNPNWQGFGEVPKTYMTQISNSAASSNVPYNITTAYANNLLIGSHNTCTVSGESISMTAGNAALVPIVKNAGYVENNVMWVHKNLAPAIKKSENANEFINMCVKVANKYNKEK